MLLGRKLAVSDININMKEEYIEGDGKGENLIWEDYRYT